MLFIWLLIYFKQLTNTQNGEHFLTGAPTYIKAKQGISIGIPLYHEQNLKR